LSTVVLSHVCHILILARTHCPQFWSIVTVQHRNPVLAAPSGNGMPSTIAKNFHGPGPASLPMWTTAHVDHSLGQITSPPVAVLL
jgi:hypothetical protein